MKTSYLVIVLMLLCLCGNSFAAAERFDCDCTDIHMHLLPTSKNPGCYTPVCGKTHTHDCTTYTCFDLDNPSCGKESKLHELTCLTDEELARLTLYNYSVNKLDASIPTEKTMPYIYTAMVTYQASNHRYYDHVDKALSNLQIMVLANVENYEPGSKWATQPADVRFIAGTDYQYNWVAAYCADQSVDAQRYKMYKQVNPEDAKTYTKSL